MKIWEYLKAKVQDEKVDHRALGTGVVSVLKYTVR